MEFVPFPGYSVLLAATLAILILGHFGLRQGSCCKRRTNPPQTRTGESIAAEYNIEAGISVSAGSLDLEQFGMEN